MLALWVACITDAYAQSVAARKVNCVFEATRLDDVIRHLSQEAGISFIYSSNKTNINKIVTLTVENRPLEETLLLIGSQLDLEFKLQGRYVMIKQAIEPKTSINRVAGKVPVATPVVTPVRSTDQSGVVAFYQAEGNQSVDRTLIPAFAERPLPGLEAGFSQAELNPLPLGEARMISANNAHAGWFLSAGPLTNDYSSGVEIQAGIRRAYVVFTPSWMGDGRIRKAFGLGSSIDLKRNFSLAPVYTFGTASASSTIRWQGNQGVTSVKLTEKTLHHQFKLMLQYEVAPSFVVRLGPTMNQSRTIYETYQAQTITQSRSIINSPGNNSNGGVNKASSEYASSLTSGPRVHSFWIGWEASFAVKVNIIK